MRKNSNNLTNTELKDIEKKGWEELKELKVDLSKEEIQETIERLGSFPNLETIIIPRSDN